VIPRYIWTSSNQKLTIDYVSLITA